MFRPVIALPQGVLSMLNFDWRINWRGQSAAEFLDGTTGVHYGGIPRWEGMSDAFVEPSRVGQWRALLALAQGRRGLFRVSMVDPAVYTHAATGATRSEICDGVPFDDGALFADGAGFAYDPVVLAVGAVSAGATTLRVDSAPVSGLAPAIGQIMSHDDWPFLVTSVTSAGGGLFDLTVQRLATGIPDGGRISLRGTGLFEAVDDTMGQPSYGAGLFARPQLGFVEALRR